MTKKQIEAKEKALTVLNGITASGDTETDHGLADQALTTLLEALGHKDVADAWNNACERSGFWYA